MHTHVYTHDERSIKTMTSTRKVASCFMNICWILSLQPYLFPDRQWAYPPTTLQINSKFNMIPSSPTCKWCCYLPVAQTRNLFSSFEEYLLNFSLCFSAGDTVDHKTGLVPVAQNLRAAGHFPCHLSLSYTTHLIKCHWLYWLCLLNHSPICPFLETSSPE